MKTGRRFFLSGFALALAGARPLFAALQRQVPPAQVPRFPDASDSGNQPAETPALPAPDPKAKLEENQKNLRKDADHLLQLARELKDEVDKTEQTDVLSLSLVKKAEEVEKLARQIKEIAKAA
jgi:hypothetical protein